jgi:hypothetical protein
MNCENVCLRLSAYQDKELSLLQSQDLERHLESCAACQVELKALNELLSRLGRLATPAPAPDFSSRIMAGLLTRPEKKYRLLPSLVPYSKFSTIFKKKICYLRDLYCEAMLAYTLACLMIFISGFLLEISLNVQPAIVPQPTTTFSAVLAESRDLGLLAVQDSTMELFSNLKQISLVKKQDNLLSKLLIPPLQGTSLRSRVSGDDYEK